MVGRLLRHPSAIVGGFLLSLVVIVSIVGAFVVPYDPTTLNPAIRLLPPSLHHPFGTDQFGHDMFSQVLAGGHLTLEIGFIPIASGLVVGGLLGLLGGYKGGITDTLVVSAIDIMLSFPPVLLALLIVALLGPGMRHLMLAIGIAWVPYFARVARGSALSVTGKPFIRSLVALGYRDSRILLRHVLPNTAGPLIVLATIGVGEAVLLGAALSFLGLGPAPPAPEWGSILEQTTQYMSLGWWLTACPGIAIALTVLGANLLGDGLRDVLDPTAQVRRARSGTS